MTIYIKKSFLNNLSLFLLVFISVIFYWFFFEINSRIYPNPDERITNLSKYLFFYNTISDNFLINNELFNDQGYYYLTLMLNNIGIKFEIFLFCLFFTYFLFIIKVYYKITKTNQFFIVNILLIILSIFWMNSLIGAVLRQGCAFLILVYCFFLSNNSHVIKNFTIFLIACSFHLSAFIFLPIFFYKFFKNKIFFLDILFIITVLLYSFRFNNNFTNIIYEISAMMNFNLRSLETLNHPTSGYSVYKLISAFIPVAIFRLSKFPNFYSEVYLIKIYLFLLISFIIGMLLSDMAYHDRIFLYGWSISGVVLVLAFYNFLRVLSFESQYK
jgi:hypothetical protein